MGYGPKKLLVQGFDGLDFRDRFLRGLPKKRTGLQRI